MLSPHHRPVVGSDLYSAHFTDGALRLAHLLKASPRGGARMQPAQCMVGARVTGAEANANEGDGHRGGDSAVDR